MKDPVPLSRLRRWLGMARWIFLAGLLLVSGLILAGGFLPVPSTLMLGRWLTGAPVMREWRPLEAISPALVHAVIASEDQTFCNHRGVDFAVLRALLARADGPGRGGSTITMQTVKNVYLWPGRSYVRKALEIPLSLAIDAVWGKRRVMEVYLNVAEWGEGLYGAEAAARHYFRKSAAALTSAEAARLAAALPNPLLRTPQRPSTASRRVFGRMDGIAVLTACL
jgi:monofunctional glycosyltransferase